VTKALFVRASFDIATLYLSAYGKKLVDYAIEKGYETVDLYNDGPLPARLLQFEAEMDKQPDVVMGFGHGNCYSSDTEILTENGWKLFSELGRNETVATLNPDTDELEYQRPTAYHTFYYRGLMFHAKGKRIDLIVTPNHNLYAAWYGASGKKRLPFHFIKANDIGKFGLGRDGKGRFISTGTTSGNYIVFKRTAKWNCQAIQTFCLPEIKATYSIPHWGKMDAFERIWKPKSVKIKDWLRFFGIWLAEGCTSFTSNKYTISVAQNDNRKRAVIKRWIDIVAQQIGCSAWEEASNEHSKAIKMVNKQLFTYLRIFGKSHDKFIPKEIKQLPPGLLKILLNAMILGDGYINRSGVASYSTVSRRLADDVQEIALKVGLGATCTTYRGLYSLYITAGDVGISRRSMLWENYSGMVYCITVPNHLVYVRRNGRPCWSGNSTIFTGQDLEVLLKVGVNDDLMSGKKCALFSCLTGVQLGPSMVEKTCPEYYGFLADFCFIYHPDYETRPLEDPWAKAFFDCVLATGYSILENRTPKEVYENTINRYNYWWDWWIKQNDPVTDDILTWLNWDRSNFIAITPTGIYEKEKAALGLSGLAIPVGAAAILFLLLSK